MNLFELFVKIGVDDKASANIEKISQKLGVGLKTAAKIGTAAVVAATTAIVALTKKAVDNYAEYEQLVGGVDTLFGNASAKLQEYAARAYETAGMSANDYMQNATAFSATLINSLEGDTEKAAEYANRAMISMSDNANKMGTAIDSIVQTYQSLSRGNFAMLDNLKLGYGGTKTELERLIADAASYTDIQREMGVVVDASSTSFANIVNAIAVVQGKLGIAGATAAEAATTIEGSINSAKAAWQNLLTAIADENADFSGLMEKFVGTVSTAMNNLLPRIRASISGAAKLISQIVPLVAKELPAIVSENLPILAEAAVDVLNALIEAIDDNQDLLTRTVVDVFTFLVAEATKMLPSLFKLGGDLISSLATGLEGNLDPLGDAVETMIDELNRLLQDEKIVAKIGDAMASLSNAMIEGIAKYLPKLVEQLPSMLWEAISQSPELLALQSPALLVSRIFGSDKKIKFQNGLYSKISPISATKETLNGGTNIGSVDISVNVEETNADPEEIADAVSVALQNIADRREAIYA